VNDISKHLDAAEAILNRAEAEGRDLDDAERAEYDTLLERAEKARKVENVRQAATDPRNRETGFYAPAPTTTATRRDPWAGLGDNVTRNESSTGLVTRAYDALEAMPDTVPDHGREYLAGVLRSDEESLDTAAFILAATDPNYTRAFEKYLRDNRTGHLMWTDDEQLAWQRVANASRAALSNSSSAAILPLALDPNVMFTNAGAINPVRRLADRRTTFSNTWNGAVSAGTTGTWTAENTALTESNPTLTAATATPSKVTAWLTASYEVFQDTNISAQIPTLVAEAFDRAEGSAFVTGSGSGATPLGVVGQIATTTASRVSTTTASTFTTASVADLYAVDNALPARSRTGRPAWLMSRNIINLIRQMSATANGSSFWANLATNVDGINNGALLLDHPVYEASSMATSVGSGTNVLLLADFSQVLVVDRLATTLEYVENVVDGNGVPTGTRGWIAHKRTTVLVPNTDSGRVLRS
jgi:HK97 family phage major capsid protein